MTAAQRVLEGLGRGIAQRSGPLLTPLVEGFTEPLAHADTAIAGPDGWSVVYDLDRTPVPAYLGQLGGVQVAPGTPDQQRAAIAARGPGRGTRAAIITAAKATLTGTKRVTLVERAGSAYGLIVQVFAPQMPDEAATRAAIQNALPAGITWQLSILTGQSWQQLKESGATWETLRAQTFDQVRSRIPDGD